MEYGFRGEDIRYRDAGRELEIEFTRVNGPRIHPRSIDRWKDGASLTEDEKARVFLEAVRFVRGGREKRSGGSARCTPPSWRAAGS